MSALRSKAWLPLAVLALSGLTIPAVFAQQLATATLILTTGADDKDHDTGVFVRVYTVDGSTTLAGLENADNCGTESCHYRENTQRTLPLTVQSRALKAACFNFKFALAAKANGNDNWEIRQARIILGFTDGTTLERSVYNIVLNSRRSQIVSAESQ